MSEPPVQRQVRCQAVPEMAAAATHKYQVQAAWDGADLDHEEAVTFELRASSGGLEINVRGPYHGVDRDPPGGVPGQPFDNLWEFEVAEIFFLSPKKNRYVELEFSPHGQHLVLLLEGRRNLIKKCLPLHYTAAVDSASSTWSGRAFVPKSYFPPGVALLNAFAIHKTSTPTSPNRCYEALYPADPLEVPQPDFHRLEFFRQIKDLEKLKLPGPEENLSDIWKMTDT